MHVGLSGELFLAHARPEAGTAQVVREAGEGLGKFGVANGLQAAIVQARRQLDNRHNSTSSAGPPREIVRKMQGRRPRLTTFVRVGR